MFFELFAIILVAGLAFLILSYLVFRKDVETKKKNRQPFAFIAFDSQTMAHEEIDSKQFFATHSFTLVNIWGTYCASCIKELPALQEIYEEYKHQNIGVIGIVSDLKLAHYKEKDQKKAIQLIEENKILFPNIFADPSFVTNATGKLFEIPTTMFVDREGNVLGTPIEGACTKEQFIECINNILNDQLDFSIEASALRCSIDGTCEDQIAIHSDDQV